MEPRSSPAISVHQTSTDGRAGGASLAPIAADMRRVLGIGLALRSVRSQGAGARMTAYRGRHLRFADVYLPAHDTAGAALPEREASRVLVSLHQAGQVVVSQGDRESSIDPGQLFVVDPTRPFRIRTGEMHTRSIYLPRTALAALVPSLEHLTALPVPCDRGPGAMLRAAVDEMFASAAHLDEQTADDIADALPHLLAPALSAVARSRTPAPTRLRQLHKQQIRRYVIEHLGRPDLDGATIASGVRLSARHVYELFADEPEPLMKWVWSLRLERIRADLAEPRLAAATIGEIAYSWGFSDVSHFSRSFRQRFGVTPREFRRTAASLEVVP